MAKQNLNRLRFEGVRNVYKYVCLTFPVRTCLLLYPSDACVCSMLYQPEPVTQSQLYFGQRKRQITSQHICSFVLYTNCIVLVNSIFHFTRHKKKTSQSSFSIIVNEFDEFNEFEIW